MSVKQISIFLENRFGRLYEVTKSLGANGINILGISVSDGSEYSVVRLIVDDTEKARMVLKEKGFTSKETNVCVLELDDRPGSLAEMLKSLVDQEMNIDYVYCLHKRAGDRALIVIKTGEVEQAIGALKAAGYRCLGVEEIIN